MKMAKSYKILISCLFAFVLFAMAIVCTASVQFASALTVTPTASKFFTFSDGVVGEFRDDAFIVNVKDGDSISFNNNLVINDMEIEMLVPSGMDAVISITADSYYVNGNKNSEGKFDTSIVTKIKRIGTGSSETISIGVNSDNYITVDGVQVETDKYYRIENIDDKAMCSISIEFVGGTSTGEFRLISVDQKASDTEGKYKQDFKLNDSNALTVAYPRVVIADSFYKKEYNYDDVKDESYFTYKAVVEQYNKQYDLTMTACSVLGSYVGSDIFLTGGDDLQFESGTNKPDAVRFKELGATSFNISGKSGSDTINYETCDVVVVREGYDENGNKDTKAPVYVNDSEAIEGFKYQLAKEYEVVDDEGNKLHSVALGAELTIPSMKDIVFDNVTSYDALSVTVIYKTRKTDSTSSTMSFKLDDVGNYMFCVVFADVEGNKIDQDRFFKLDDNNMVYGDYKDYIFSFKIEPDAPIKVEAPMTESKGYRGVQFVASKFDIDANECTITYKLYYNASANADPSNEDIWVEIPKASSVTDKNYNKDGYNYNKIKEIGFDGERTFKPTDLGSYKLVCEAASNVSSRSASDYMVIKVTNNPSTVVFDSHWLQNNIWSVVFLSIGTLCLIGIIVLLFTKPKDKANKK